MARVTAAVLHSNNSRHRTILNPLAAKEVAVAATAVSSNSAMAISVTPASAATTATTDVAGATNGDAADSVRRTDRAAVEVEVEAVVVAAADKSRHLVHRSLR
jgi:hypothetical protein